MISCLTETRRFLRENDWRTIFARMASRDAHPMVQLMKYGLCGVGATLAHNATLIVVTSLWLPVRKGMLIDGLLLDDDTRAWNLAMANVVTFPVGLLVAYLTNARWVFTPGRHSRMTEFGLFAMVSAIAFFPGLLVVDWLVSALHLPSTVAQLGFIITSVAMNFVCRKFIIFKR